MIPSIRAALSPCAAQAMCSPKRRMNDKTLRWRNRLYLRIYVAVLSGLALVALLAWIGLHANEDADRSAAIETFAEVIAGALPPAPASRETQEAALKHWGARMHADLSLYGSGGELIASSRDVLPAPDATRTGSGLMYEPLHRFSM